MMLRDLLSEIPGPSSMNVNDASVGDTTVTAVTYDSRQAGPGAVFVALRGVNADGASFARDALNRGAVAVVSEVSAPSGVTQPWIQVPDARLSLAALSATLYEHPSEELTLVGITGTNGKTTTSYLLTSIFEAAGIRCGRIGTVGYQVGSREVAAARTTPEAPDLQRMLREMVTDGCGACVMEVSSHALTLRRADHLRFATAVFTNLTRDHLDFHSDMEAYFVAKRRLAELLPEAGIAVTNVDDPRGRDFAAAAHRAVTYAIDAAADVRPAGPLAFSLGGLAFEVRTPRGSLRLKSPLVGRPNAYNILAAVAAAMALDVPFNAIETGIAQLDECAWPFSGRLGSCRRCPSGRRLRAHRRCAQEPARNGAAARRGRVITVFGCGGDRDRTKRPLMGAVAARLSDLVIITSDNPRSEDPDQIIDEVKRGIVVPADRAASDGVSRSAGPRPISRSPTARAPSSVRFATRPPGIWC